MYVSNSEGYSPRKIQDSSCRSRIRSSVDDVGPSLGRVGLSRVVNSEIHHSVIFRKSVNEKVTMGRRSDIRHAKRGSLLHGAKALLYADKDTGCTYGAVDVRQPTGDDARLQVLRA